jgi:DNA polymerase III delta prime subunit
MNGKLSTLTDAASSADFSVDRKTPVLLVTYTSEGSCSVDRCALCHKFVVGRNPECDLVISDSRISGVHFCIKSRGDGTVIKDLKSRNGTYVNGRRVIDKSSLENGAVIRAGRSLFVFQRDGANFLKTPICLCHHMAGSFYTPLVIDALREATLSKRNMLISGPTGTGKELVASAVAEMMGRQLYTFNAARMASKEETSSTLFGVTPRFFSNVEGSEGLIETARNGVLFIDEVHNLESDIQRALLRVIESGETARVGESVSRQTNVRFILASNETGETRGLVHDLFARLRLVTILPLAQRRADIPDIFVEILKKYLRYQNIDSQSVVKLISADHMEALLLDGFPKDNVRGLVNLADRISTRIAAGSHPNQALSEMFDERFGDGLSQRRQQRMASTGSSRYERNREMILSTYESCGKNISSTEKVLKGMGFRCSRRWLGVFITKWGGR